MRKYGFLFLVIGIVVLAANPATSYATKSELGNEWVWAANYPILKSTYGQAVITVAVKYVVSENAQWMPNKIEYEVHMWTNNNGTGWDDKKFFDFNCNYSSEHSTTPIIVGNGAKYFKVKANKCTFIHKMTGALDPVSLEDSGYVRFRD